MARKIGVIGLGHVGVTLVHELLVEEAFDTYVLIDPKEEKVQVEVLDFQDRVANTGSTARFVVNDYTALADADIVVSSLGQIDLQANQSKSRFAEFPFNSQQVKQVSADLVASGFSGVLVVITNPCDAITALYQHYTGFPKERVMGTGTLLDTARLKRAIGAKFSLAPTSVTGYMLGEHGNSQFPAWSQVRVKDSLLVEVLGQAELDELAKEARQGGHTVFFGKGYTNFAIAAAAKRLITAILTDSRDILPVSHYREEFGTCLSYPAVVGKGGIVDTYALKLVSTEETLLADSARLIRENVELALADEWDKLLLT